jgi:type I restriction enzyme S subunit
MACGMSEANVAELPNGWVQAELSAIASINPSLDRCIIDDAVVVDFVPMRAVEPNGGGLLRPEVSTYGAVKKGYTAFLPGDVIMAKITPCMENGKICLVPELPGAACFGSTEFHVVRAERGIDARWLANFLLQHSTRHAAQRQMMGGVGQMRVPSAFLESLKVPVPSASEQCRILDLLDELLSDLDAGVAALERVQAKLKHYRASVLKAAVEGTMASTVKPYPIRRIGDAIESLGQGWSPKCESQPAADSETWAVIKTTAIQPLRYLEEHNKTLPATLKSRPQLELVEGDLLITRAGPRTRVGVACLVKRTRPRLMLCDKAYRLRCKKDTLSPAFLEVVLNAPHIVTALDKLKTGINDSGLNLTQDRFSELLVPFPPPGEQQCIVETVDAQLSIIDHLESDLESKLKSAQALRQSILRHAFTGQLVPQDPTDEPASELLKRIAAERTDLARRLQTAKQKKTKPKMPRQQSAKRT